MMAVNEGVGKKIVEALKKQSNAEIELTQNISEIRNDTEEEKLDFGNENVSEINVSQIDTLYGTRENAGDIINSEDTFEIKEDFIKPEEKYGNEIFNNENMVQTMPKQPQGWNFEAQEAAQPISFVQSQSNTVSETAKQFEMPPNVAVLKRLITQLPAGVTRQTGAQIIKQTMEALGISMNTVLHEAQKVQDDMNESIKNCMTLIQEYKNNIRNLEKQGMDYQRQVNQLNDLISLFILSDKE